MNSILLIFIGLFFCIASVNADDAQNNLRTLFTSSSERDQLDKQRDQGKFDNQQSSTPIIKLYKPITVHMQGVVIRKDHKPVVFINDSHNLKSNKVDKGITVKPTLSTRQNYIVPILVNQNRVKLKPGQQWSESGKTVKDDHQVNSKSDSNRVNDENKADINSQSLSPKQAANDD